MYAVGQSHPLRETARALVAAAGDGRLRATTTPEVIQEFAHVRARRRDRADAAELARSFASVLAPLIVVDTEVLRAGLDCFEASPAVGAFDAVLAAAALESGALALISADRAFQKVAALEFIDLGSAEAAALAAA